MRLWQVKTLSLKGKEFKGPLKGAEMALHRRRVRNSKYKVFRVGTVTKPFKVFRGEPVTEPFKVFQVGTVTEPFKVFQVGTVTELFKVFRVGTITEPFKAFRVGTVTEPFKVFRVGTVAKPPKVVRGEPVNALTLGLNICHPKLFLHPLKIPLCRTFLSISFGSDRRCWSLSSVDTLACYLVTGITKDKGSANGASNQRTQKHRVVTYFA